MDLAELLAGWRASQSKRQTLLAVDQALAIGVLALEAEIKQAEIEQAEHTKEVLVDWRRALRTLNLLQRHISEAGAPPLGPPGSAAAPSMAPKRERGTYGTHPDHENSAAR